MEEIGMKNKVISILVFIVLCAAVCLNTGCGAGISVQGGAAKAYIKEKYGISARVRNVDVKKAWCLERGSYYAGLTEVKMSHGKDEFTVYYDEDDNEVIYDDYQTDDIKEAIVSQLSNELTGFEDIIVTARMAGDLSYDGENIAEYLRKAAEHKGKGYVDIFVAFVDKDLSDVRSFSKAGGWIDEGIIDMKLFSFVSKEDMERNWSEDGLFDLVNFTNDPLQIRERRYIEHGKDRSADFYEKREIKQYKNLLYSVPEGLEVAVYTIDEYTDDCEDYDDSVEIYRSKLNSSLDEGYVFVNKNGGKGEVICMYPLDKLRYFGDVEDLGLKSVKGYYIGDFSFDGSDYSNVCCFSVDTYK